MRIYVHTYGYTIIMNDLRVYELKTNNLKFIGKISNTANISGNLLRGKMAKYIAMKVNKLIRFL